jgi:hypothetical protein
MEYDSDDSEVYPLKNYQQDPDIPLFRRLLSEWKQQKLEAYTETAQDPSILQQYAEECQELYNAIDAVLKDGPITETTPIFQFLQNKKNSGFTTEFLTEAVHALQRDLIECKFTYDPASIDATSNSLNTEFISNK